MTYTLEYDFGTSQVIIDSIEEVSEDQFKYTGFQVIMGESSVVFQRGLTKLATLEGEAQEKLDYFFENLARAYEARSNGEDSQEYLNNINL